MNFDSLTKYLDSLAERGIPSFDCAIRKDHKEIYRHMGGYADAAKTEPIRADQRYLMFSMTKIQTMTAILQLVEQGKMSLDDPVSRYLPSFAELTVLEKDGDETKIVPADRPLLVRHLVSMQSGLDYDLHRAGVEQVLAEKGAAATTRELVDAMPKTPLLFQPGTHFLYSLSHDVAAAIVEVVSGMSFGEYLRKYIWEPLGIRDTAFAKPMNCGVERLAQQYWCPDGDITRIQTMEPSCDYQLSGAYESGGAGLMSCTEDYALLADALACGGIGANGARILRPETVETIKQNLLGPDSRADMFRTMGRPGYGYGCGMQVLLEPEKAGTDAPAGVFGWDGAAGSCAIMDTANSISLVFMIHVRNCGMAYGEIHPRLRDEMFRGLGK